MADDQKPKTMDINDLVRELSKSSTSPVTPSPAPGASRPSFPTPKPMASPPPIASSPIVPLAPKPSVPTTPISPPSNLTPLKPLEMTQPKPLVSFNQSNLPKAPTPPGGGPVPSSPLPTSGVKEYQSSVRTMNEDISKLKQGQKPTGVDIPRKVEQVAPVPQPMPPKSAMPSQQFKVPSVNLGEAQKTGPLAQSKNFSRPVPVIPRPVPIVPKVESKPQIYVPQEGQKNSKRNMLFMGIGAIALMAGFSYWFFILRSSAPEVVKETPTPTVTVIPIQDLNNIFAGATELEPTAQINGGEFKRDSQSFKTQGLRAKLLEIIDGVGGKYPTNMVNILGKDAVVLWYGQKELFSDGGQLKVNVLPERRLVIINEIIDTTLAMQSLSSWEGSMSEDLKLLVPTDKTPDYKGGKVSVDFADNFYRGVSIRYNNFPFADKSIDYSIILASNDKSYLVIASSREAMYATIDKLKGF